MYAAAHHDLIRAAVVERLGGSTRRAESLRLPAAPARITTWGPRASRRPEGVAEPVVIELPRDIELPRPRVVELTDSALLLDA